MPTIQKLKSLPKPLPAGKDDPGRHLSAAVPTVILTALPRLHAAFGSPTVGDGNSAAVKGGEKQTFGTAP